MPDIQETALFGAKDFYDLTFRAITPMKIQGEDIAENEVLAHFSQIRVGAVDDKKWRISAHGGYDDRDLVIWEEVESVTLNFTQGVFSKQQLGLLSNTKIWSKRDASLLVPICESLESDGLGQIGLKYEPEAGTLFVYEAATGKKISYDISARIVQIEQRFLEVNVYYYTNYTNGAAIYQIGEPFTKQYLKVEGKTRLKDDNTGKTVTGIVTIPRLRLMTGLSIRLGADAIPMVQSFQGLGFPTGTRGNKTVATFTVLSDDIDSDF